MKKHFVTSCISVLIGLLSFALSASAALEDEIRAFEAADALAPPPKDAILFVGSSTIRMWPNLPAAFPPHVVLNRGFGGSQMSDVLAFFDRVVAPYEPSLAVVYEGDNDLAGGKTVDQVYADYTNFLARINRDLPGTQVAFMSVKPSPSRAGIRAQMEDLNRRLRALSESGEILFIDIFSALLNSSNQPDPALFQSDMLHLNAAGYAAIEAVVRPALHQWALRRGYTALADFGAAANPTIHGIPPGDPERYWNNITPAEGATTNGLLTNLVTSANVPSGIRLAIVRPFNGANDNGSTSSSSFPASATRDSLFGNTEVFNGLTNVFPRFQLGGLDRSMTYDFTFFASRAGVSDNRETEYTVSGANTGFAVLNAANNATNTATVHGITPNGDGEVFISLAPTTNNNSPSHFTYLGVLRIDAVPPQTPIGFTRQPSNQTAQAFQSVEFRAAVTGAPPYSIQWYLNGSSISGATRFAYVIPSVSPGMDGSLVSVTVSNLLYGAVSTPALLSVLADTNPPVLLSASSIDGFQFELSFSEPLREGSITAANFTVNGLEVKEAMLLTNRTTVTLTMEQEISGEYLVVARDIEDLSGNAMTASVSGIVSDPASEGVLIDFGSSSTTERGPAPDDPLFYWNNVTETVGCSDTGRLPGLVTTKNNPSGLGLVMVRRFNGANLNGTTAPAPLPADATRDSLYGNTESFNGLTGVYPAFRLTGLMPVRGYDITLYASRTGVSDNRETAYTIAGAATNVVLLNAANNITNLVTASAVRPNASGELLVSLAPGARNNNANHFTYLGAMKVSAVAPLKFSPAVLVGNELRLNWSGNGILEWAPTLEGPWAAVSPAPASASHSEPVTNAHRFFRLRK